MHVGADLNLHDRGMYASGGFMANMQVDGDLVMGSQQQWFTRNAKLAGDKAKIGGGDTTLSESLQFSAG